MVCIQMLMQLAVCEEETCLGLRVSLLDLDLQLAAQSFLVKFGNLK